MKNILTSILLLTLASCGGGEQEYMPTMAQPTRPKSDVTVSVTMPKVVVGSDSIIGSYMLILIYKDSTGRYVGQVKDFGF